MPVGTKFTRLEVAARNTRENATVIIDNVVYDVTKLLNYHPGGRDILLQYAGKDASEYFRGVRHSDIALDWRKEFVIGVVADEDLWEIRQNNRERLLEPEDYLNQPGPNTFLLLILAACEYYLLLRCGI